MADPILTADPPEPVVTAPDWRADLPDDLKADKTLATVKDIPALAKMVVEGQKWIGSSIRLPGKDAKPEELAKWISDNGAKVKGIPGLLPEGAPISPDQYAIQRPEIALDVPWDEQAEKGFLAAAHKAGLSNAQAQMIIAFYGDMLTNQVLGAQDQAQQVEADLRKEWGPNYDANLGRANRAIQEFGGKPLIDLLAQSGMGRHPLMVRAFVAIGNAMVEHGALPAGGEPGVTPEQATQKIREIRADKTHPFNNGAHPDHHTAIEEVLALRRVIEGANNAVVTTL
jgi:hypothetical protein